MSLSWFPTVLALSVITNKRVTRKQRTESRYEETAAVLRGGGSCVPNGPTCWLLVTERSDRSRPSDKRDGGSCDMCPRLAEVLPDRTTYDKFRLNPVPSKSHDVAYTGIGLSSHRLWAERSPCIHIRSLPSSFSPARNLAHSSFVWYPNMWQNPVAATSVKDNLSVPRHLNQSFQQMVSATSAKDNLPAPRDLNQSFQQMTTQQPTFFGSPSDAAIQNQ